MIKSAVGILLLLIFMCSYSHAEETQDAMAEVNDALAKMAEEMQRQAPVLADHLEECKELKQEFTHPFTGQPTERNIVGMVDGKCLYREEMPNNGMMECKYTEDVRKAVANEYREIGSMQEGNMVKMESVDGEEVESPLMKAMNDGTCEITGYE